MNFSDTTVAALSTPYGRGAIAMIRMTGDRAIEIAEAVFIPRSRMRLSALEPGRSAYGVIMSDGRIIDDGVAVLYRAPHSYTGEDMAEICCHGGILVSRLVLQALFDAGALPAGAGEFTRRAFLNGKLKLSQAEAIMDVIDAETPGGLRLAGAAERGRLSGRVGELYDGLKTLISSAYAYIDYPDEDLTDVTVEEMKRRLDELIASAGELKDSYKTARAVCEGIKTVICGKPNVGKSSLLNLLTGEDAAIVTETAGTTRDIITRSVACGEVLLRLSDTAGIHETDDGVESLGVKRAVNAVASAQLVLAVFDGSRQPDAEDAELLTLLKDAGGERIAVINKTDEVDEYAPEYVKHFTNSVRIALRQAAALTS